MSHEFYLSADENRMLQRNFLSVPKSGYMLLRKEEFHDVMTFQGIPACSIFSNAAETEEHLQRKVTRCNNGEYHSCKLGKLVNMFWHNQYEQGANTVSFSFLCSFYHPYGNVFTSVCHSVHMGGGYAWQRGNIWPNWRLATLPP